MLRKGKRDILTEKVLAANSGGGQVNPPSALCIAFNEYNESALTQPDEAGVVMPESIASNVLELAEEHGTNITDIVGPRLPRRWRRRIAVEKYELLRECYPFGSRAVRDVATERGMDPKTLWRWLHSTQLQLELLILEHMPYRAALLIQRGRELREESCKLDHAEDYLKWVRRWLPRLELPNKHRTWLLAECNLELGHVYRDRGGKLRRQYAIGCYGDAFNAYRELEGQVDRRWANPDVTCGWIVAQQNQLQMRKIQAVYQPQVKSSYYRGAVQGYRELLNVLENAPKGIPRYRERMAETWQLMGEIAALGGDASEGLRFADRACDSDDGSLGDLIGRRRRRAQALITLGDFDHALEDLAAAEKMSAGLGIEKGIQRVLLDGMYCTLYRRMGDKARLAEIGRKSLLAARRLGLGHEAVKLQATLAGKD